MSSFKFFESMHGKFEDFFHRQRIFLRTLRIHLLKNFQKFYLLGKSESGYYCNQELNIILNIIFWIQLIQSIICSSNNFHFSTAFFNLLLIVYFTFLKLFNIKIIIIFKMTDDEDDIKEVLKQHGYEFIRFLGKGSFSSVYLCRSQKYQQDFAIKRTVKHRITDVEYNTLVSLNHSNIVKLYDAFDDDTAQYLVMEYCCNGTLRQKGKLPYDTFIYYAKQLISALSYCHSRNVAHRDIKPDNIFLDQYGQIKLADFGLAKHFENDAQSNEKCGSLMYFAPEMFIHHSIDPFKADIWALGITFFYMTTGRYPYDTNSREDLKNMIVYCDLDLSIFDINPKISYLIGKMTRKSIEARSNADELLNISLFTNNTKMKRFQKHSLSHVYTPNLICGGSKNLVSRVNANSFRIIKPNPKNQRINLLLPPLR